MQEAMFRLHETRDAGAVPLGVTRFLFGAGGAQ
jgi:hypothetical protein